MRDPEIASFLIPGAMLFLVLAFLTLRLAREVENRLIFLGLLTAVLGLIDGWLGGVHVAGGPANVSVNVGLSGVSATMMKIGFLLVLGGIMVAILGRWPAAVIPAVREEAPRV